MAEATIKIFYPEYGEEVLGLTITTGTEEDRDLVVAAVVRLLVRGARSVGVANSVTGEVLYDSDNESEEVLN
jgi:hypothetical protein